MSDIFLRLDRGKRFLFLLEDGFGDGRILAMDQANLFGEENKEPLAAKLRPQGLEEFVGQEHL
ncbi:MAG TPA: hypothetical protein DEA63_03180, partial [Firmicutes bacterium]|nr:hypothetical protein [Bacillota bacterium]